MMRCRVIRLPTSFLSFGFTMKNRSRLSSVVLPLTLLTFCLSSLCVIPRSFAQDASSDSSTPDSSATDEASVEAESAKRSPVDDEGRVVNFQRDIAPIFREKCLKCHGPDDAKNDFRIDEREMIEDYVDAGDVDSSLYIDYLITDDEDMLMPPTAHGGPLSPAELAMVRVWIAEGAVWPEGATVSDAGEAESARAEPAAAPKSLAGRVWAFQGFLHPAVVHFPIAFLLLGALFVVVGVKWPAVGTQIPLACLLLGAPAAVAAAAMGWSFATQEGYPGWTTIDTEKEWFWHRWSGVIVAVLAMVFAVIALLSLKNKESKRLNAAWKIGLLALAAMVGAVGHQGGEMSYGANFYDRAFNILLGKTDAEQAAASEDEAESKDFTAPADA